MDFLRKLSENKNYCLNLDKNTFENCSYSAYLI